VTIGIGDRSKVTCTSLAPPSSDEALRAAIDAALDAGDDERAAMLIDVRKKTSTAHLAARLKTELAALPSPLVAIHAAKARA